VAATVFGKGAFIEAHVDISFGLDIYLSVAGFVNAAKEVIMENSNSLVLAFMASVWCGVGFLRSPGGNNPPTRTRDRRVLRANAFEE
jgi:hypothetical protein